MLLELEPCRTLVEKGVHLMTFYFWIVCMSMLLCVKEIFEERCQFKKKLFKTSVNSTDKSKCSMAISSTRKGRVGRELFKFEEL